MEENQVLPQNITTYKVSATDGYPLEVNYFEPENSIGQAIVMMPATGVLRRFYNDFMSYLAVQGFHAYNFDYRGIGGSREGSLKGLEATAYDWALKDAKAVIDHIADRHLGATLTLAGHSIGGQLLALLGDHPKIHKAMLVAAQSGYWKHWSGAGKLQMFTHTHVLLPAITHSMGYFPAKKLKLFEDLPKGAALEWAKWCRSKNYLFDHYPQAYDIAGNFQKPILMYSFEDDSYAPARSVEWFKKQFLKAPITHHHYRPEELGIKAVGHFNFFRKQFQDSLWADTVQWLKAQ